MKHSVHSATKLNFRDIQKCNCFRVPFASAREANFFFSRVSLVARKTQHNFIHVMWKIVTIRFTNWHSIDSLVVILECSSKASYKVKRREVLSATRARSISCFRTLTSGGSRGGVGGVPSLDPPICFGDWAPPVSRGCVQCILWQRTGKVSFRVHENRGKVILFFCWLKMKQSKASFIS